MCALNAYVVFLLVGGSLTLWFFMFEQEEHTVFSKLCDGQNLDLSFLQVQRATSEQPNGSE